MRIEQVAAGHHAEHVPSFVDHRKALVVRAGDSCGEPAPHLGQRLARPRSVTTSREQTSPTATCSRKSAAYSAGTRTPRRAIFSVMIVLRISSAETRYAAVQPPSSGSRPERLPRRLEGEHHRRSSARDAPANIAAMPTSAAMRGSTPSRGTSCVDADAEDRAERRRRW